MSCEASASRSFAAEESGWPFRLEFVDQATLCDVTTHEDAVYGLLRCLYTHKGLVPFEIRLHAHSIVRLEGEEFGRGNLFPVQVSRSVVIYGDKFGGSLQCYSQPDIHCRCNSSKNLKNRPRFLIFFFCKSVNNSDTRILRFQTTRDYGILN